MSRFQRIVILTGAGISAESGIHTFRDQDGIWSKVDVMDVAPDGQMAAGGPRAADCSAAA